MVKNTLRRKLFRDMWRSRMQFVAMILLCALGSFAFSGLDASWRMIDYSAGTYFEQQSLADLWVTMQQVDRKAITNIENIQGVNSLMARASLDMDVDSHEETALRVEAVDGAFVLNKPLLSQGEMLQTGDRRGCLLDEEFAKANGYAVGDRLTLKLNGVSYTFLVRGLCLEPEFIALSKHTLPDPNTYGFVLLNSCALPMIPLNELVLGLGENADLDWVKSEITRLYPEALIVERSIHSSANNVQKDVEMFRNLSYLFPLLAFGVAAMIVLTTITRMLENQRMQMGTLKALGFHDGVMLRHYLSYAFYPSLIGSLLGLYVGRRVIPSVLWVLEDAQFNMPYRLSAPISVEQWVVCGLGVVLACFICLRTYRKASKEQTAQLLRPKPPKAGKKIMLERIPFIWKRMGFNSKMMVRNLFRNKLRTAMSLLGILCCTMLIITAMGLQDSLIYFVDKYYEGTLRYTVRANLSSTMDEVEAYRSRIQCERLEGLMDRTMTVRFGSQERTSLLSVLEDDQQLLRLGEDNSWIPMPQEGVLITQKLSEVMNLQIGDSIELWLAGEEEALSTFVSGITPITVGQQAFMSRTVWEKQRKGSFLPTALLLKDPTQRGYRQLEDLDEVDELLYPPKEAQSTLVILDSLSQIFMILSVVALGLAFVVLYNMGLLNYMERYREYATLKVLGYRQGEIRRLITGENRLLSLMGIVLGIYPGKWLTSAVMHSCETESMIFLSTVNLDSIMIACTVTFLFSCAIARFLSYKVRKVDMVEALKSVE